MGGCESALLADLAGARTLANTQQHFESTSHHGPHRDDGFAAFKGLWIHGMIVEWREHCQKSVIKLAGGDYPVFTCDLWVAATRQKNPSCRRRRRRRRRMQ